LKRTICVVTGSRAEYGLLRGVMEGIQRHERLRLQIVATGMHLCPEFGLTYREIEADGLRIDRKMEILLGSDTAAAVTKSMGLAMIGFADALQELKPDVLLLLGDRFETLAAASAALVARIPIAHVHGGERTEGAFDDAIRHAVTKMSHLHFVAAEEYRLRVLQLGEDPDHVFHVGGLGVDRIKRLELLDRRDLEESIGFRFGARNLLVTFHPSTLDEAPASEQMAALLQALAGVPAGTGLIFTLPNADPQGRELSRMVEEFVARTPTARAYPSLGQQRYLSCVREVDGVVGNSSSGLLEVPSLGKGTVNIGSRQNGRLRAASVIDCEPTAAAIAAALERLYSREFQLSLANVENPYGDGGAGDKIVACLAEVRLDGIMRKTFHDRFPGSAGRDA
jgi:GDP/UDP-N,N'-diacetylbacillosamine 2-epimerase (hydrolysing)